MLRDTWFAVWSTIHHHLIWKFKIWPAKYWVEKLDTENLLQVFGKKYYALILFFRSNLLKEGKKRPSWFWEAKFPSTDNYKYNTLKHNFKTRIELCGLDFEARRRLKLNSSVMEIFIKQENSAPKISSLQTFRKIYTIIFFFSTKKYVEDMTGRSEDRNVYFRVVKTILYERA